MNKLFKKRLTKTLLFTLIALVITNSSIFLLISDTKAETSQNLLGREYRLNSLFDMEVEEIKGDNDIQLSSVKPLKDFSGNKYTLIECEPTGYIIYHDASGIFVEYGAEATSPYIGMSGDLYYAGLKGYYSKENTSNGIEYVHTVISEILTEDEANGSIERCNEVDNRLFEAKNDNVLNYIENGKEIITETSSDGINTEITYRNDNISFSKSDLSLSPQANMSTNSYNGSWFQEGYVDSDGYYNIKNADFFYSYLSKTKMGYVDGGYCGYNAGTLLLGYHQYRYGGNFIGSSNYYWSTYPTEINIEQDATNYLISVGASEFGLGAVTTPWDIYNVMKYVLDHKGLYGDNDWYVDPVANNYTIEYYLDRDCPVLWFGYIVGTGKHVVTLYGYKRVAGVLNGYLCHFGWPIPGYEKISFTGVLGGMYSFRY